MEFSASSVNSVGGSSGNLVTVGPQRRRRESVSQRSTTSAHREGVSPGYVSSQVSLFSQMIRSAGELRPKLEPQRVRSQRAARTVTGGGGSRASAAAAGSHLGYTPVGKPAKIVVDGGDYAADDWTFHSTLPPKRGEDKKIADEARAGGGGGQGYRAEEWAIYEEAPPPPPPPPPPPLPPPTIQQATTGTTVAAAAAGTETAGRQLPSQETQRRQREYTELRRRREASEARRARGVDVQVDGTAVEKLTREEWTVYETIPVELAAELANGWHGDVSVDDLSSVVGYRRYLESPVAAQQRRVSRREWTSTGAESAALEFSERRARDGVASVRATTPVRLQKWTEVRSVLASDAAESSATSTGGTETASRLGNHRAVAKLQQRAFAASPIGYKRYLETAASTGSLMDASRSLQQQPSSDYFFYSDENDKRYGVYSRNRARTPKSRVYKRVNLRSYEFK